MNSLIKKFWRQHFLRQHFWKRPVFFFFALGVYAELAFAQTHPFSVGVNESICLPQGGFFGWVLQQDEKFSLMMKEAAQAASLDFAGLSTLIGACFAYGVFHAIGPGHGKAVLAAYAVANQTQARRGAILSLCAGLLQAAVAIVLIGGAIYVFGVATYQIRSLSGPFEIAAYGATALLGLWLATVKGLRLTGILRAPPTIKADGSGRARFVCESVESGHRHTSDCGHLHAPDPKLLGSERFSWGQAMMAVLSAGARPCSGAILLLIFAARQSIFSLGVMGVLAMGLGTAVSTAALTIFAVNAKSTVLRLAGGEEKRARIITALAEMLAALGIVAISAIMVGGVVLKRNLGCF